MHSFYCPRKLCDISWLIQHWWEKHQTRPFSITECHFVLKWIKNRLKEYESKQWCLKWSSQSSFPLDSAANYTKRVIEKLSEPSQIRPSIQHIGLKWMSRNISLNHRLLSQLWTAEQHKNPRPCKYTCYFLCHIMTTYLPFHIKDATRT